MYVDLVEVGLVDVTIVSLVAEEEVEEVEEEEEATTTTTMGEGEGEGEGEEGPKTGGTEFRAIQ